MPVLRRLLQPPPAADRHCGMDRLTFSAAPHQHNAGLLRIATGRALGREPYFERLDIVVHGRSSSTGRLHDRPEAVRVAARRERPREALRLRNDGFGRTPRLVADLKVSAWQSAVRHDAGQNLHSPISDQRGPPDESVAVCGAAKARTVEQVLPSANRRHGTASARDLLANERCSRALRELVELLLGDPEDSRTLLHPPPQPVRVLELSGDLAALVCALRPRLAASTRNGCGSGPSQRDHNSISSGSTSIPRIAGTSTSCSFSTDTERQRMAGFAQPPCGYTPLRTRRTGRT